jgi:hypothetical protein
MKKLSRTILYCSSLLTWSSYSNIKAQVSSDFADNNCIKKDNIIIDAFYGWPYFNGTFLRNFEQCKQFEVM